MNRPVFVTISGKKKHGKNFFADKVKELLVNENISFAETAFATPIKNFCHDVFGIPMEDLETQEGKLKNTHLRWSDLSMKLDIEIEDSKIDDFITIRELLQIIGTEVFREGFYGPIWAEAPFRKKHLLTVNDINGIPFRQKIVADVVFITDCRFPNEVEEARRNDSLLVRVVRDDIEDDGDAHTSEIALDDFKWGDDEVVTASTNDGRLDDYAKNVLLPRIKGQLYGN